MFFPTVLYFQLLNLKYKHKHIMLTLFPLRKIMLRIPAISNLRSNAHVPPVKIGVLVT